MTKVLQFEHHKKKKLRGPKLKIKHDRSIEPDKKTPFWWNSTKSCHFGVWHKKLKIKTSKHIEIWVQIPHVPQLLSEFFSPHLHQPWLSAGVQNALVCNCPKSMRWCFTCMFISWCKYWQRTIVDKSTYDKIYWKKGSTKIHFFQKASESSRTQNIISFSQSNTRAGHQKHSQNDEFHLFIVNCTCFCKKNSWHHVIGHFEKHPLVHLIPLVFLTQSQTLGKKQHTLEK